MRRTRYKIKIRIVDEGSVYFFKTKYRFFPFYTVITDCFDRHLSVNYRLKTIKTETFGDLWLLLSGYIMKNLVQMRPVKLLERGGIIKSAAR